MNALITTVIWMVISIVPIIMAIWFGGIASKAGRSWFGWALAGAAISFVVSRVVAYVGDATFGPFSPDSAVPFLIISTVIAIGITLGIGAVIASSFKKRPAKTGINRQVSFARMIIWTITLGLVGFICGSMGQSLLLAEMDNAAPVIGLFTGPIGLFVGAFLGALSTRFQLSPRQNLLSLVISLIIGSVGTLYLTVSEFTPTIQLVDAEIVGCESVDKRLVSQTKMWSEVAARPHTNARPNWEQEIPDMLRAQPGVVLTMRIYQEAWVREQRWRWGGVSQRVDDWLSANETKQVFAAIAEPVSHLPCESFTIGERRFSALVWEKSNPTPPATLPAFLWLYVLQQVPPEYIRYIPKPK